MSSSARLKVSAWLRGSRQPDNTTPIARTVKGMTFTTYGERPNIATRPTRRVNCNHDTLAGFAAAHGYDSWSLFNMEISKPHRNCKIQPRNTAPAKKTTMLPSNQNQNSA